MTPYFRKTFIAFILIFFYAAFIFLLFSSYHLHSSTKEWTSSYEAIAEVGFFLTTFIYFKGLGRWIYCLLAVVAFSLSAGSIHFYFSEIYGDVDWKGISGAMNVVAIQAMFSTYIFLITAASVWIMRFVMKKISIRRLGHH